MWTRIIFCDAPRRCKSNSPHRSSPRRRPGRGFNLGQAWSRPSPGRRDVGLARRIELAGYSAEPPLHVVAVDLAGAGFGEGVPCPIMGVTPPRRPVLRGGDQPVVGRPRCGQAAHRARHLREPVAHAIIAVTGRSPRPRGRNHKKDRSTPPKTAIPLAA